MYHNICLWTHDNPVQINICLNIQGLECYFYTPGGEALFTDTWCTWNQGGRKTYLLPFVKKWPEKCRSWKIWQQVVSSLRTVATAVYCTVCCVLHTILHNKMCCTARLISIFFWLGKFLPCLESNPFPPIYSVLVNTPNFHWIGPLGQFGLVIAMSVCIRLCIRPAVYLVPFLCSFFGSIGNYAQDVLFIVSEGKKKGQICSKEPETYLKI